MTLAGVAQSVERVALINSKEINLKVVGSSPTFGYSYHKLIMSSCSFAKSGLILSFLAGPVRGGRRRIDVVSWMDVAELRGSVGEGCLGSCCQFFLFWPCERVEGRSAY
jgi:hypothetical protein